MTTGTLESTDVPVSRSHRVLRIAAWSAIIIVAIAILVAAWGWITLRASLPARDGTVALSGLSDSVTIEFDALGIPLITASNEHDLARALGFLHAQERRFQMDLLRRQPAGELSELFGPIALESDRGLRLHRFRSRAEGIVASMSPEMRSIAEAYADGVNRGTDALGAKPWEYFVLRAEPEPWTPEDSMLVVWAMYLDLHDSTGRTDSAYGLLHDTVSPEMFDFLAPRGTKWDAAIDGSMLELPSIPPADVPASLLDRDVTPTAERDHLGSNNFAVDRSRTADGRAILAGDMHLGISVPNIWYRAAWKRADDDGTERIVSGVTLPGAPGLISGSNGRVAWAFTNSYGDWTDLVVIEESGDGYITPDGIRPFERHRETIRVKGAEDETIEVEETIWGPVIDRDHAGRKRALRWVAHHPVAVNFRIRELESASSVEEALDIANRVGAPAQNFVAVDDTGTIGWTIMGPIPRRIGEHDPRLPFEGSDGASGWNGWLSPDEYPRIVSPPDGLLWTANTRVVGGEMLAQIGDGGYALGARGRQIRDRLRALDRATERDLLAVQLDDEAIFLAPWRDVLIDILDDGAVANHPGRREMKRLIEQWGGRASVDSPGYRLVRAFRSTLLEDLYERFTSAAKEADERFSWERIAHVEHPLWLLVTERPAHLLDPRYETWDAHLLAAADETIDHFAKEEGSLADRTWGERNTSRFRHPLAGAIPLLGRQLEFGPTPLPGDSNMPRFQSPTAGASQRMVVSPGRESDGIFHMPGGESSHPLSPNFDDGHAAWVEGRATPFLPTEPVSRLTLVPGKMETR